MRILVSAGEASGDRNGAQVLRALRARVPGAEFVGLGGEAMAAEGLSRLHDVSELSVMGFVEVLPRLAGILRILGNLVRWAERNRPDAAILLDAPDFNLRLARELRHLGIPIFYVIAPMAWAWRESRVRMLRDLDALLCIYPFEEEWFSRRGVPARYVGNPLLDDPVLAELPDRHACRRRLGFPEEGRIVALLPGSRTAEICGVLGDLLGAAEILAGEFPGVRFALPLAHPRFRPTIEAALAGHPSLQVEIFEGRTSEVLRAADAAAVCSGTATLQAALALCPEVMVYRAHPVSVFVARRLVRLSHACIVNILLGKPAVPELLQEALRPETLAGALSPLLSEGGPRERMLRDLSALRAQLGGPGFGDRAAAEILSRLADRVLTAAGGPAIVVPDAR